MCFYNVAQAVKISISKSLKHETSELHSLHCLSLGVKDCACLILKGDMYAS